MCRDFSVAAKINRDNKQQRFKSKKFKTKLNVFCKNEYKPLGTSLIAPLINYLFYFLFSLQTE